MHDPMTVAFDLKIVKPWTLRRKWPSHWHLVTVWHVDPERDGSDDSCGWFSPKPTADERARIQALGEREFYDLFGLRRATADNESYASVCYEPTPYDAVYWAWRAIRHQERNRRRGVWKYGEGRDVLTSAELQEIYHLASNPIDNFRVTIREVKDKEGCGNFFLGIYRCYRRFNRPWWQHPRWHIWHWKLQIQPLQSLHRWLFTRCTHCGKAFRYGESPVSHQWDRGRAKWFCSETGLYHEGCSAEVVQLQRAQAEKKEAKAVH